MGGWVRLKPIQAKIVGKLKLPKTLGQKIRDFYLISLQINVEGPSYTSMVRFNYIISTHKGTSVGSGWFTRQLPLK